MPAIHPCLWFDSQGEQAAQLYTSLFPGGKTGRTARFSKAGAEVSGQKEDSVMTVEFEVGGLHLTALNGGPMFKFNPSCSLFVWCESDGEIETYWHKLSPGGKTRMALGAYPWSEKYAWFADKYGVEWQLMKTPNPQKMAPALLFVDKQFGKGQEAVSFYQSVFKNSEVQMAAKDEKTHTLLHCRFTLDGHPFVLMEGPGEHGYEFNEAFSFQVMCKDQAEMDHYYDKLMAGGGQESNCGWLKDKYGVSWQVVPVEMAALMSDPRRAEATMQAMLPMKRLDLAKLKQAAAQVR